MAEPLGDGEWVQLSTMPSPTFADSARAVMPAATLRATVSDLEGATEPVKLSATLRTERMELAGSQMMRVNKNRCLRVAGVELYWGKLVRSTVVNVIWDQAELMVITIDGELVAKFDFTFPDGVTYLRLKHAKAKFQNMPGVE